MAHGTLEVTWALCNHGFSSVLSARTKCIHRDRCDDRSRSSCERVYHSPWGHTTGGPTLKLFQSWLRLTRIIWVLWQWHSSDIYAIMHLHTVLRFSISFCLIYRRDWTSWGLAGYLLHKFLPMGRCCSLFIWLWSCLPCRTTAVYWTVSLDGIVL